MSTRAFNTGVSGTKLTAAERAFGRGECPWDFIPLKPSVQIATQATVAARESTALRPIADDLDGRSIPVDGAADPAHLVTTSATMIAQVIRSAVGFQALLMSDDVSMMNAPAGGMAERVRSMVVAGCDTLHSNDNAKLGPSIARADTASA